VVSGCGLVLAAVVMDHFLADELGNFCEESFEGLLVQAVVVLPVGLQREPLGDPLHRKMIRGIVETLSVEFHDADEVVLVEVMLVGDLEIGIDEVELHLASVFLGVERDPEVAVVLLRSLHPTEDIEELHVVFVAGDHVGLDGVGVHMMWFICYGYTIAQSRNLVKSFGP
jgi:hypothetical protein